MYVLKPSKINKIISNQKDKFKVRKANELKKKKNIFMNFIVKRDFVVY